MVITKHIVKIIFFVLFFQSVPVQASDSMAFVKLVKNKGGIAPALRLTDIHSRILEVKNFKDKVTLVHFWATWCVPCLKELPELQRLSKKYQDKGLRVIAIATDSHEAVKEFIKKRDTQLYIMVDQYGSAMRDYKVKGLPSTYIVDKKGELHSSAIGPVDWFSKETRQLIDNLVAKP